jgi:hypothetical protein
MRARHALALTVCLAALTHVATPATAALLTPGATAPAWTKTVLDADPWPTASQSQFAGKVLILHILGFDCQYCLNDGPSVETSLNQYYKTAVPGQVQVLGCDVTDGSVPQLRSFRTNTGVTYPLLLACYGSANSPQNMVQWYGERDHFTVVNKHGIVRYNSALSYAYGNGYHLNEIRACVDSLVTVGLGVPTALPARLALAAGPSPARGPLTVMLALPRPAVARVAVHDVSGRRVAMLWDAVSAAGERALVWDGADDAGVACAPGVYMVVAEAEGARVARRVVVVR